MKSQDPSPCDAIRAPEEESTPMEIVTVRPTEEVMSKQRLPYFFGVSDETSGARGISMSLVVIPPGGAAEPHYHRGFETAIYMLEGSVETRYGKGLRQRVTHRPGDFLFIPPGVPHQPVNLSEREPARAIVARNNPSTNEEVVFYDPDSENRA
ncbi:MAG: cupin domain-containing protein [Acidobacteria bacterium]|nr:cupin domain-containing protein [Acidobacteriota bacterium]